MCRRVEKTQIKVPALHKMIVDLYEHFEGFSIKDEQKNRSSVCAERRKKRKANRAEKHSDQTIISCCSCRPVSPALSVMAHMCSSARRGHFNTRHDIIVIIGRTFSQPFQDSSRFGPSETLLLLLRRVGEHPGSFRQVSPF